MLKIFTNYRRVYVTRDNQVIEVTTGDVVTQDEFATMFSEGDVECIDVATDAIVVCSANSTAAPVAVAQPVAQPAEVQIDNTPAPDAGLVPEPVSTGSKNAKA